MPIDYESDETKTRRIALLQRIAELQRESAKLDEELKQAREKVNPRGAAPNHRDDHVSD